MSSLRVFRQRAGRLTAVFALLAASVVPAFVPGLALADQATARSIELSDATAGATSSYKVAFTPISAAGKVLIDFCTNSPTIGDTCAAPSGFSVTSAGITAVTPAGATIASPAANQVVVTGSFTATASDFTITGVSNPTNAGSLYARVLTYSGAADLTGVTSADPDSGTAHIDDGGVAMYIHSSISVQATVAENLTFCVASADITAGCNNAAANLPTLKLGTQVGDQTILAPGTPATGDLYTQISTNAGSGAVVNLKSSTTCGGLKRAGVATCDIAPITTLGDITGSAALFGIKLGSTDGYTSIPVAAETVSTLGDLKPSGTYTNANYFLDYSSANPTTQGITSVYGSPILNTNGAPVLNKTMKMTFGAAATSATPAGTYSTALSMIATGTF